MTTSMPC